MTSAMATAAGPCVKTFALVGSPNSGKSTLFNALTRRRVKTGNYPGVTVERKEGIASTPSSAVRVLDLPGTYSLTPVSEDEQVVVNELEGKIGSESPPDGVIVVADSTTLERTLPLLAEVLEFGRPTLLVLTMIDELKARGGTISPDRLSAELGIRVVGVVGTRGVGIDDLRALLDDCDSWGEPTTLPERTPEARFAWSDRILSASARSAPAKDKITRRLDAILLHPLWGSLVFLIFVTFFFQAIFTWAEPAMNLLRDGIDGIADWLQALLPAGLLASVLTDGVVRGVGAVLVFLPQILLLFLVIFLLEACGYMARAAFLIDRIMGWVGLEGRCFIALLSSYACAVPGILATRTIPSRQNRLATILVAPFMTCSARLPVYTLLIAAFIAERPILGPIGLRGLVLFGLYLLGSVSALVFAAVFKRGLLRGAALPFYLELPPYRLPSPKLVLHQVWRRLQLFIRRAGTIILATSILLWCLLHFPQRTASDDLSAAEAAQQTIEQSYGADIGRALEPVFEPLGFDWRVNVGLLGSFAAREVIISTLAQIYAQDETKGLGATLAAPDPETGRAPLDLPAALALLVFFVFALQCVSTIAVMKRETNSWRWPAFALGYMAMTAWLAAWVTHTMSSL